MVLSFVNRAEELEALEKAYASKKAEFFIIYGRRRVGKTELIKEFCKNKAHFYFLAKKQDLNMERETFQNKFAEKFNLHLKASNFEELFDDILKKVKTSNKLIVAIDEFPYWISKDETILFEFQHLWDELLKNHNILLIICGSYLSVMEERVLGYKSPLYGRRTGQLKIEPLMVKHIHDFLPKYEIEGIIKVYGAVGTMPFYLKEMDDSISFTKNIEATFLNKANILNKEAVFLLREELRETDIYFNILKAIIDGATTISEIASKSRVDITNINKYLATIKNMRLIRREKPITSPQKEKKYLYKLEDNYFRFWLTYIYPNESEIEENSKTVVEIIEKDYNRYLGTIFEDFCKKILRELNIPAKEMKIGTWWHKEKEIDIVGINEETKEILFAECKWQDNVDAVQVLEELKEKAKHVDWNKDSRKENYAIFAKSFSKKTKGAELYDLKDIEKALKS